MNVLVGLRDGTTTQRDLRRLPDVNDINLSRGHGVYIITFWDAGRLVSFYFGQSQQKRGIHQRFNNHRAKAKRVLGTTGAGILYGDTIGFNTPGITVDARVLVDFGAGIKTHDASICVAEALCIAFTGAFASGHNLGYWRRYLEELYKVPAPFSRDSWSLASTALPSGTSAFPLAAARAAAIATVAAITTTTTSTSSRAPAPLLPLSRLAAAAGLNKELAIESHRLTGGRGSEYLRLLCSNSERQARISREARSECEMNRIIYIASY